MKLSAPVYQLKRQAKSISREEGIALHKALDRVALAEGFRNWSLLAAHLSANSPSKALLDRLRPGDLVLLGARPGQGKTMLSLELIVEAMKTGHRGFFFTLEFNHQDMLERLRSIEQQVTKFGEQFLFDDSDDINAAYVIERLSQAPRGSVVVIDYLQLLDQKRTHPDLMTQVRALKDFAAAQGVIIVFISQVDRAYETSARSCPGPADVRLPNPLDLTLFDKSCFLHEGEVRIEESVSLPTK